MPQKVMTLFKVTLAATACKGASKRTLLNRCNNNHNNNNNNILYSSLQEINAVVRSHNKEHISISH